MDVIMSAHAPAAPEVIGAGDTVTLTRLVAVQKVAITPGFGFAEPYDGYALEFARVAGRSIYPITIPGAYLVAEQVTVNETNVKQWSSATGEAATMWSGSIASNTVRIKITR